MEYTGIVQEGLREGETPTINIPLEDAALSGVYAAHISLEDDENWYEGVAYANQARGILEAYLFEFDEVAYGKRARITLEKKLREHRDFASELEATNTIMSDIAAAGKFFMQ